MFLWRSDRCRTGPVLASGSQTHSPHERWRPLGLPVTAQPPAPGLCRGEGKGTASTPLLLGGPRPRPPPALSPDVTRGRSARRTLWSPRGALRGALWRGRAGCQRGAPEGSGAGPGRVGARGAGAMGVPKFYRWVSERYPCLSQVLKEHQVRRGTRRAGAGAGAGRRGGHGARLGVLQRHPRVLGRRQGPSAAVCSAGARRAGPSGGWLEGVRNPPGRWGLGAARPRSDPSVVPARAVRSRPFVPSFSRGGLTEPSRPVCVCQPCWISLRCFTTPGVVVRQPYCVSLTAALVKARAAD